MPRTLVTDRNAPRLTGVDYALGCALGLVGLITMIPIVSAARPGYLSCTDCVPYIVQAHVFAGGHLTRAAPPEEFSPFFQTLGMFEIGGREFSRQPPGASAVFALFMAVLRDIRLAPPVVSALAIALTYLWVCLAYNRKIAVTAVSICLLSSVYHKVVCCSLLSYVPSSLFFAAGMLMLTLGLLRSSIFAGLACGFFVGLQFTVRPFTALLTSMAMVAIGTILFRRRPRTSAQGAAFAAGFSVGLILLLIHNRSVTGNWWPLAFTLSEPNDRLGFGLRGLGAITIEHTPTLALKNLLVTFHEMCMGFFWHYLLLIPIVMWWIGRVIRRGRSNRGCLTRWDFSVMLLIAMTLVGHTAYWCARPINYSEAYPLFAVLVSRGIWYLAGDGRVSRYAIAALLPVLIGASSIWIASRIQGAVPSAISEIHEEIERARLRYGKLLLFVDTSRRLGEVLPVLRDASLIAPGLFNCSTSPDQPVIYAVNRGAANEHLVARYPDRYFCVLGGTKVISASGISQSNRRNDR